MTALLITLTAFALFATTQSVLALTGATLFRPDLLTIFVLFWARHSKGLNGLLLSALLAILYSALQYSSAYFYLVQVVMVYLIIRFLLKFLNLNNVLVMSLMILFLEILVLFIHSRMMELLIGFHQELNAAFWLGALSDALATWILSIPLLGWLRRIQRRIEPDPALFRLR